MRKYDRGDSESVITHRDKDKGCYWLSDRSPVPHNIDPLNWNAHNLTFSWPGMRPETQTQAAALALPIYGSSDEQWSPRSFHLQWARHLMLPRQCGCGHRCLAVTTSDISTIAALLGHSPLHNTTLDACTHTYCCRCSIIAEWYGDGGRDLIAIQGSHAASGSYEHLTFQSGSYRPTRKLDFRHPGLWAGLLRPPFIYNTEYRSEWRRYIRLVDKSGVVSGLPNPRRYLCPKCYQAAKGIPGDYYWRARGFDRETAAKIYRTEIVAFEGLRRTRYKATTKFRADDFKLGRFDNNWLQTD